jgi:hypothetical protein
MSNASVSFPLLKTRPNSFIVKIWLEPPDDKTKAVKWRGHITQVPSGRRVYIADLNGIGKFIAGYLIEMGADLSHGIWRFVGKWL